MEEPIYGNGYAGRFDLIARLSGIVTLVDFKTSKGIYPSYGWQIAAYKHAWNSALTVEPKPSDWVEDTAILRLDKESGEFEYKVTTKDYKHDLEIMQKYVDLWWLLYAKDLEKEKSNA